MVVGMPALGMGVHEPAKKLRQLAVAFGSEDEVPMIGHDAIAEQTNRMTFQRFDQDAFKGVVVAGLLKQGQPRDRPIEGMMDATARSDSGTA